MKLSIRKIIQEIDEKDYPIHGKIVIQGIPIEIENKKGTLRVGYDKMHQWCTKMGNHYGRIPGTKSSDGDMIDVFVGNNKDSNKVFIVFLIDSRTKKFDEIKAFIGFNSPTEVKKSLKQNYDNIEDIFDRIEEININEFKKFLIRNMK